MSSVSNREQLSGPVLQEFERLYAWLRAFLRQEHNDDGSHRIGEWTPYTPAWRVDNGDPAPDIGNGRLEGRYTRIGNTVHLNIFLLFGSTTTVGSSSGSWTFTPPFPRATAAPALGTAYVGVIGADNIGLCSFSHNGNWDWLLSASTDLGTVGDTFPGWSAGDSLQMSITYETTPR